MTTMTLPTPGASPDNATERPTFGSGRRYFDTLLNGLQTLLLQMGVETETMLRDAVTALSEQNDALTEDILRRDDAVDALEEQIEAECLHILTTQQPVLASDLRIVSTVMKAITDIERIGDHTVNIARTGQRLFLAGGLYRPLVDVPRLADAVRQMLHDALEAIVHRNVPLAEKVIEADTVVDAMYSRMRRDLQAQMQDDPNIVLAASHLMFVLHYLERIGDHCVGIAERSLYMQTGQTPRRDED